MSKVYKPRNDFVVVKQTVRKKIGLVAVPEISKEGKEYHVVAIGPKVEGLKIGEQVLMTGQPNVDWSIIPGTTDHIVIREGNIILIIEGKDL